MYPSIPGLDPPPASAAVQQEWLRRVEAEYHSCAVAHHLTLWLIQIAASPDLITAGLGVTADELAHAQQSHDVFLCAGGAEPPQMLREHLALPRDEAAPLEHDVLRACVEVFCLGETVAVPLFKELRANASVPVARATLDRVLLDEVRHRDFGWSLLEWLLSTPHAAALRQLAQDELPAMLARLCNSYVPAERPPDPVLSPEERAWGLMPTATYGEVLRRTFSRDYLPRFHRLGITCPPLQLPP